MQRFGCNHGVRSGIDCSNPSFPWGKERSLTGPTGIRSFYRISGSARTAIRRGYLYPFKDLPQRFREALLYGSNGEEITFYFERNQRRYTYRKPFEGIIPKLKRRYLETDSHQARDEIRRFLNFRICPECKGSRSTESAVQCGSAAGAYLKSRRCRCPWACLFYHPVIKRQKRNHCRPDLKRNYRTADFPEKRRSQLSDPWPVRPYAFRRRKASAFGWLLKSGRSLPAYCMFWMNQHRSASTRQSAAADNAAADARSGQYRPGRRT